MACITVLELVNGDQSNEAQQSNCYTIYQKKKKKKLYYSYTVIMWLQAIKKIYNMASPSLITAVPIYS